MSVLKPRSRPVSFRLSAEEYRKLEGVYARSGARSISHFARAAVMLLVSKSEATTAPEQVTVVEVGSSELKALRELQAWIRRVLMLQEQQASADDSDRDEPEDDGPVHAVLEI
jgi:hypothetical protein